MHRRKAIVAGLIAILSTDLPEACGQGNLNPPPGPPAPTMKSLDQIEARIIVNATNTPGDAGNSFIISAPGSYYLTSSLTGDAGKNGISIQANNVTLDLNGFAIISGGGANLRGVDTPAALSNFCIRNGTVTGWTNAAVWAGAATTQADKLRLVENIGGTGLVVANGSIVKDCVATANAIGFFLPDRSQASGCIATINTGVGFNCTAYVNLLDCTSSRNGGDGIVTLGGCNIIRCSSTRNLPFGDGFSVTTGCNFSECTATQNGGSGIRTKGSCTIAVCMAGSNGGSGISSTTFGDPGSTITNSTAHNNAGSGISNQQGTITNCAANSNGAWGLYALDGSVSNSTAHYNAQDGIFADNVSNSAANSNGESGIEAYAGTIQGCKTANNAQCGIYAPYGSVASSKSESNGWSGIYATDGTVTGCTAHWNVLNGIDARDASVTHCTAQLNGNHGISVQSGVLAFCVASGNNRNNNGSVNFDTPPGGVGVPATTRTGNNPTP